MSNILKVSQSPAHADCGSCELFDQCHGKKGRPVRGERPKYWKPGGLMIVGEGPGAVEAQQGRPFVGPAGRLLDALLLHCGTEREACWVTSALMGQPPRARVKPKGGLHERFPNAVYSCLPRLEAEIEEARPRVILATGMAALVALTGHEEHKTRWKAFECRNALCTEVKGKPRYLRRPALACANGQCSWHELHPTVEIDPDNYAAQMKTDEVCVWTAERIDRLGGKCPKCEQSIKRLRTKRLTCPTCNGKKKLEEPYVNLKCSHKLIGREGVAGAVFRTEELPSRLDTLGVKYIIATYNPGFALRGGKANSRYIHGQYAARAMTDHLAKAKSLLTRDARWEVDVLSTTDPRVVRDWLAEPGTYAVDIETNSEDGPWAVSQITCVGFARADRTEALVVDTRHLPQGWHENNPLMDTMHAFLCDETRGKVLQNGTYDRIVLRRLWGVDIEGVVGDTMLAHNALYPDEEHGLGFIAHELLDAPAWKDERKKIKTGTTHEFSGYSTFDGLAHYNAQDTRATALADEVMRNSPRARLDLEKVRQVHDHDLRMQHIAIDMEWAGLPVSTERFREIEEAHVKVMDAELVTMREMVGRQEWTPRGQNLLWAMFDPAGPLHLTPLGHTDKGQASTKKELLIRMADQHPFVQHLLRWRKYEYALSHYVRGDGLAPGPDGRIHPTWKVHGARTGRWSSSPNFQNWPKGDGEDEYTNLRSAIVPEPGRVIVGADYAQLELRIMGSLSGDPDLIRRCIEADESKKLEPDFDPHSYTASLTFGRTFTDLDYHNVKKDKIRRKALRDVAKRVFYGLGYGAGAATIRASSYDGGYEGPPLTTQLIQETVRTIFKAFPGIATWRDEQVRRANETREIRSPVLGRHRIFPLGEIDVTVCYNYPIQSGAADIMNAQLDVLAQRLPAVDPGAVIIAQVHDAIYVECDEDTAEAVAHCVTDSLSVERALTEGAVPMPYPADAAIATSWDKAA
jgi:uracil-DNA glycosylase family 4